MTIAVGVQLLVTLAFGASLAASFYEPSQLTFHRSSDGSALHVRLHDGQIAVGTWWLQPDELWQQLKAWRSLTVR